MLGLVVVEVGEFGVVVRDVVDVEGEVVDVCGDVEVEGVVEVGDVDGVVEGTEMIGVIAGTVV